MQTRISLLALVGVLVVPATAQARVLQSADELDYEEAFDLSSIMELAVDSVLAAQGPSTDRSSPSRRVLYEVAQLARRKDEANKATINKLQSQKAELEKENRSLHAACLKSTHIN
eukprot:jgi/Tetstr1/448582/TSEL_035831.t1